MRQCELCPRMCGVDRLAGGRGYCGAGAMAEVYRYGPHFGEEPPISGNGGSGTIFFSRCTMRCLYCQNYPWSQEGQGEPYSRERLTSALISLAREGCANWNLVSPTPWLPLIEESLDEAAGGGTRLPVVYNTSGFERVETLARWEGRVGVYLTDLRYARPATAAEASGTGEYVEIARAALWEMQRQTGPLRLDDSGMAMSGTICRILILPGHADEAIENLRWLGDTFGGDVAVSVMAQYVPAHRAHDMPWCRTIRREEYDRVCRAVEETGTFRGWVQEYEEARTEELAGFRMKSGHGAAGVPQATKMQS